MAVSSISSLNPERLGASATQAEGVAQRNGKNTGAAQGSNNAESAVTRISDAGRARYALEQIKSSTEAAQSATRRDATAAVEGVVQSVNQLYAANPSDAASRNAAEDNRAAQAQSAVKTTLDNASSTLSNLGVTQTPNGLNFDARQLGASLDANPSRTVNEIRDVAKQLAETADRQLNPSAGTETAKTQESRPASNSANDTSYESRQQDARAQQSEDSRQRLAAQLAGAGSYPARIAVTSYFSVATL
jgi:hypothetical protein